MASLTVCTQQLFLLKESAEVKTTGDAMMEQQHIADGRDDCRVPWIRTYSPERAQMGTDTDHVYPPIVPVKGDLTARQRPSKMQNSQIAEEREDCGTLSVCTPQLFLSKEIQPNG